MGCLAVKALRIPPGGSRVGCGAPATASLETTALRILAPARVYTNRASRVELLKRAVIFPIELFQRDKRLNTTLYSGSLGSGVDEERS